MSPKLLSCYTTAMSDQWLNCLLLCFSFQIIKMADLTDSTPDNSNSIRKLSRNQILTLISTASLNFSSMICYSILGPFFPQEVKTNLVLDPFIIALCKDFFFLGGGEYQLKQTSMVVEWCVPVTLSLNCLFMFFPCNMCHTKASSEWKAAVGSMQISPFLKFLIVLED